MLNIPNPFSARRGSYRIIYTIHNDLVVVRILKVDHRKSVYRKP